MKQSLLIITIILSLFFSSFSSVFAVNDSQIDTEVIDNYVKQAMKDYDIPGMAVGIVKDNEILYVKGYGVADDEGRAVTPQTPFSIGSVSKSFTGLAIMQLVEEGKIDLDSPVQVYVPWFTLQDTDQASRITVRQLLHHTSALSTFDGNKFFETKTDDEFMRMLASTRVNNREGSAFEYSNLNYMILGKVIESASGTPYEIYMIQHIFKPLEMKNSYTDLSTAINNGLSSGYQSFFGMNHTTNRSFNSFSLPAGFLMSSTEDMAHYLITLLNLGTYKDQTVLSRNGIYTMREKSNVYPYGMGWGISRNGILQHGGDLKNFHSDIILSTYNDSGIVVLINKNELLSDYLFGASYSAISWNLFHIWQGSTDFIQDFPGSAKLITSNVLVTLGFVLTLWFGYRTLRNRSRIRWNLRTALSILILNLLLPTTFLYFFLKILVNFKIDPSDFLSGVGIIMRTIPSFFGSFGYTLIAIPITLYVIGIVKVGFLIWNKFIKKESERKFYKA